MGQGKSKDAALYRNIIENTLKGRSHKVSATLIQDFLQSVQKVHSRFPEQGILDIEIWEWSEEFKSWYNDHSASEMPPTVFSMWSLLKVAMVLKQEGNTALASQHYSDKFKDSISQESLKNLTINCFL